MNELMVALLVWISGLTGYNVHVQPPRLHFLTPQQVSDICIDEGTLVPYVAEACYKYHEHAIYMRNNFNIHEADKVGVLVHELTHVLQLSNGQDYNLATMDHYENEAERIEAIYEGALNVQQAVVARFAGQGGRTLAAANAPVPNSPPVMRDPAPVMNLYAENQNAIQEASLDNKAFPLNGAATKIAHNTPAVPVRTAPPVNSAALKNENSPSEELRILQDEIRALREEKKNLEMRLEKFEKRLEELYARGTDRTKSRKKDTQSIM